MSVDTKALEVELPEQKTGGVSFCLIGSTRSGKTTLLKHIVDKYFPKHIKVLMSNSIHAPIYKEIDDCIKSPVYSHKVIKEGYEINRKTNNHYRICYILDDVVDKKNDKELMKLLTIYRNSGLSTIISLQSPILMNTTGRGNVNFVCLGKMNSDENIEKVVRMYLMSFLTGKIDDKIRQYKILTEDHYWFMVDNLEGTVYRFKIKI
jgi:tRNA A37 threonylcarbamoyladenosine biosynthesis protein TsaE